MSEVNKKNPLLFSANVASPFDDLSASSLLVLPKEAVDKQTSEADSKKGDEGNKGATFSLQPHLDHRVSSSPDLGSLSSHASVPSSENLPVVPNQSKSPLVTNNSGSALIPGVPLHSVSGITRESISVPNALNKMSVLPPPTGPLSSTNLNPLAGPPPMKVEGSTSMRRPGNKYIVPQEIGSAINQPPNSSQLPSFAPSPLNLIETPSFVPPPIPSMTSFAPPPNPTATPFIPPPPIPSATSSFVPPTNTFIPPPPPPSYIANLPMNANSVTTPNSFTSQSFGLGHPAQSPAFQDPSGAAVIPPSFDKMASSPPVQGNVYHPVIPHWFFLEGKPPVWKPFSFTDSLNLEAAYMQNSKEKISCDGGRYDVLISERQRRPVYWDGEPGSVRRCSWFRKLVTETLPVPYSEDIAAKLENEYREAMTTGHWHRQVELPGGERVMINSPFSIHHYQLLTPEAASSSLNAASDCHAPQTVKRGAEDFEIKEGTSDQVDHLMFLIHGIGSVCDLTFRSVEECVNDFRSMGEELLSTHFKQSIEMGKVGRVEILPISWHKALHGEATGLDEKLKQITLRSIPKFREFTNDTLLDILYYTSPVYCQHIMDTVTSEMDRLLSLFRERNPAFSGGISLGGHSLGSVILFDLLMHQNPRLDAPDLDSDQPKSTETDVTKSEEESTSLEKRGSTPSTSTVSFEVGVAGTGQPSIVYPQISFKPQILFLMGSPVAMFVTVRGIDKLGPDFKLPTCDRVFNIFHPYDPVAYRIETLVDPSLIDLRPVLIPHHKGRKRLHLELKDTIERVGSDLKNKIVDSIQSTWNKFYQIYSGSQNDSLRQQLDEAISEKMSDIILEPDSIGAPNVRIGHLNEGNRVDYVLQEKPYESFTEYIFALQAHVNYWTSEDTLLMMLKEIYKLSGTLADNRNLQEASISSLPETPSISRMPTVDQPLMMDTTNFSSFEPQAPVPLLSPPVSSVAVQGPPPLKTDLPKTLRGRPVFDPLQSKPSVMGMDPTAMPSKGSIAPPPIVTGVVFNKK